MDIQLKIIKVGQPEKSNSSNGRWAIPIDLQYTTGAQITANTWKYAWHKTEAIKLYQDLKSRIGKTISIFDL